MQIVIHIFISFKNIMFTCGFKELINYIQFFIKVVSIIRRGKGFSIFVKEQVEKLLINKRKLHMKIEVV